MREDLTIGSAVAQKDRISIDVSDLRGDIETCRSDAAWSELPLAAKIRVLVKERLEEIKVTPTSSANVKSASKERGGTLLRENSVKDA